MKRKLDYRGIILSAILVLLLIFGVPIMINYAYNIGGYKTNWGAEDVLSFYGTILGSIATLAAVIMTIKHENKIRKLEDQRQKNNDKLQQIKTQYNNALLLLDSTHTASMYISHDNPEPALNHLNHLSLEIRRTMTLEVLLDSEQKTFLGDTTAKIKLYAEAYAELIIKLKETYAKLNTIKLYENCNKLLDLLKTDYEKNKIEIDEVEKEISKLHIISREDFEKLAHDARMEIVSLNNKEYAAVYDSVISGINSLEQHYDSKIENYR